jgi:aminoglycoside phosphotransferase (APT) family kinase protein
VRALLRDQFPHLADRALVEIAEGWDSSIYRLGDDLIARLQRRAIPQSISPWPG